MKIVWNSTYQIKNSNKKPLIFVNNLTISRENVLDIKKTFFLVL